MSLVAQFRILYRKEWLFQRRTRRWGLSVVAGSLLVLMSMGLEWGLGVLRRLIEMSLPAGADTGGLMVMLDRDPALWGAAENYFKNFPLFSMTLLLMGMGILAAERRSGELSMLLVRPVSRAALVAAKFMALWVTAMSGLWLSLLLFYILAAFTLHAPLFGPFMLVGGWLSLFLSCYMALCVWASSCSQSAALVAAILVGAVLLSNVSGAISTLAAFLPEGAYQCALSAAFGRPLPLSPWWSLLASVGWSLLWLFLAYRSLSKMEGA